jgi:hypothetical protein
MVLNHMYRCVWDTYNFSFLHCMNRLRVHERGLQVEAMFIQSINQSLHVYPPYKVSNWGSIRESTRWWQGSTKEN